MSASNERAELQKQQEGLEASIMTMSSEGIPIPEDLSSSLIQIRTRLNELGGAANVKPWTSWLGQLIEEFTITDCLSKGSYANVFRAQNYQSGQECAFKISRSDEAIPISSKEYFSKQALKFHDEILQHIDISANEALRLECDKLQEDSTGAFVKVLSSGMHEKSFYYRMPLLAGQSLKELAAVTDAVLLQLLPEIFGRVAELIDRVGSSNLHYHGNLQADNILITRTDAVLLSPGLFDAADGSPEPRRQLTTPAYYPFFEPNDVFALGCVLWELICKTHPLAALGEERTELFTPALKEMLDYRKALNHEPLCNYSRLKTPMDVRKNLADNTENLLMKAIKLGFDHDGYITGDPGFKSAGELSEALEKASKIGLLRSS